MNEMPATGTTMTQQALGALSPTPDAPRQVSPLWPILAATIALLGVFAIQRVSKSPVKSVAPAAPVQAAEQPIALSPLEACLGIATGKSRTKVCWDRLGRVYLGKKHVGQWARTADGAHWMVQPATP